MSLVKVIEALSLPPDACVNQRVPKKLLFEQDIPTAADKRQIQDGIEEMIWVAALKPTNIGVPIFKDNVREYLEIAVITTKLHISAKPTRIIELIHRAIPYPVVLITSVGESGCLSLAHKRWSQGEIGKVVIEDIRRTHDFIPEALNTEEASFIASLKISDLPNQDLYALYQGLIDCIAALGASKISGKFALPSSKVQAHLLSDNLDEHARIQREIIMLRAKAEKEKQLNRRVELNLEIKRLEEELAATKDKLRIGET
ncbi:DUF4391 domain-containing protein [Dehalococcoides mccartyi]|uniref:DUF4391 domain-containing protein n=1 Tax=Dehalococcoides mccartyi TaxID=61435 RepID=UPI001CE5E515|nr:DUF4391 domain-containing protein [Dehalococcoides mccartyi]QYY58421.1 DUF4391 domain-containing protein [Dehalococcoides mccartyi]